MNDIEEYEFGIRTARDIILGDKSVLEILDGNPAFSDLPTNFAAISSFYDEKYAKDIFLLCFSEHKSDNTDGILSMWRAYGGEGAGVALVFDTSEISEIPDSPIVIARVIYKSTSERQEIIKETIRRFCFIVKDIKNRDDAVFSSNFLFNAIKVLSLITKNRGFQEEREWRAIYLPERDQRGLLKDAIDYNIGEGGIEPKLKLRLKPLHGAVGVGITLDKCLRSIILGPTRSTALAREGFDLMLRKSGREILTTRVLGSSIPLRPRFGKS